MMERAEFRIHKVLAQLADMTNQPRVSALQGLSDLGREDLERFQAVWKDLPVERRRWVVRNLAELAEERVELYYVPIFRWLLRDPDPEVRVQAIDGLWEDDDPALIGPLLHILREDSSEAVRAAAAISLGRFILLGEMEEIEAPLAMAIEKALLAVIHTPEEPIEVRRRAVEAIAYSSESGVRDIIRNAYYDEDDRMRISAIFAMGRSADQYWRPIVIAELDSPQPAVRFEAARACGELSLHEAIPKLVTLAGDPDVEVCQAALWALGQIGGPEARRTLLAYTESENEAISEAAEDALDELEFWESTLTDLPMFDFGVEDREDLEDEDAFWDWGLTDDGDE
ncbi:MAG: HEAT repeat domain-containing protein [Anaerolineae bacterium]|nr:HEAT repeat domain-containing protein [Anaerolineae bacterium]